MIGIMWTKDPSGNFPYGEVKAAKHRFGKRPDLIGYKPAAVHLHEMHKNGLPDTIEGLPVVYDWPNFNSVWVTGEPTAKPKRGMRNEPTQLRLESA